MFLDKPLVLQSLGALPCFFFVRLVYSCVAWSGIPLFRGIKNQYKEVHSSFRSLDQGFKTMPTCKTWVLTARGANPDYFPLDFNQAVSPSPPAHE